jgi:hypothetical protein
LPFREPADILSQVFFARLRHTGKADENKRGADKSGAGAICRFFYRDFFILFTLFTKLILLIFVLRLKRFQARPHIASLTCEDSKMLTPLSNF